VVGVGKAATNCVVGEQVETSAHDWSVVDVALTEIYCVVAEQVFSGVHVRSEDQVGATASYWTSLQLETGTQMRSELTVGVNTVYSFEVHVTVLLAQTRSFEGE
jgi:hypothetical protein